jgi:lipopolysaccharide biosynthesis regulator YciM
LFASIWTDFRDLIREQPLVLEGIAAVLLFVVILLVFRRVRLIAAELERRKALGEYVRGLDEFLRGDYRQAIGTLEKVLERDPESVEGRIALGDCLREVGDPAEGKKHHHHVHKVFGHELARNFVSLGRDELALKNYDRAAEAFGRVLELTPGERDALAGLAQAYAEGGNPVEAAAFLRQLYPRGPAAETSVHERRHAARRFAEAGQALLAEEDAEGAVKLFTEALAFQPTSIRARTGLVRAAHGLGDHKRARRLVEKHVAELKRLAVDEEVLFEPASAQPAAAEPVGDEGGTASYLPARIEELGGVVAQVEEQTARYVCAQCGALARAYARQCPACEAVGTLEALSAVERIYLMPIAEFRAAVDEVEENAAFVQGLAHKASTGDDEALRRLREKGTAVFYDIFAALPAIEARRYLGMRLAELGPAAAREVRLCHAARGGGGLGAGARPPDEFAAAFYLALPARDAATFLGSLGEAHDAAVAGVMADPRVAEPVRDAARERLRRRGTSATVPVVEAVAASGDHGAVARAAELVHAWGEEALELLERRYLQGTLLGRLLRVRKGARRRATADILARTGLRRAADALARAAAKEKDPALRAHYVAAKQRAAKGGSA